jgi:hypothetical protein
MINNIILFYIILYINSIMTSNLKNITNYSKQNNNSFSDYKDLNKFLDKLAFTRINKNKNIIKNIEQVGGNFDFSAIAKKALGTANQTFDAVNDVANQASTTINHAASVANQVSNIAGEAINSIPIPIPNQTIIHPDSNITQPNINPNTNQQLTQIDNNIPNQQFLENQGINVNELHTNDIPNSHEIQTVNELQYHPVEHNEEIQVEHIDNIQTDDEINNNEDEIMINCKDEICEIPQGVLLYFPTTDTTIDPTRKPITLGKGIKMLTPDHSVAFLELGNCGINSQNGAIYLFMVKNNIPGIFKHTNDIPLDSSNETFNKKFCGKNSKYNGIGFKYPSNNINEFNIEITRKNNKISNNIKMNHQFWMCESFNADYYLEHISTEKCRRLGSL